MFIYRGVKLPLQQAHQIEVFKNMKNQIYYLNQFTSTSVNKSLPLALITKNLKNEIPMLLEIELKRGMKHNFYLNSSQYTNYSNEKEVILDDGVGLWVKDVVQEIDRITKTPYTLIKLQMSSKSRKSDSNVLIKI